MAAKQVSLTPLIDIQTAEFAEQYENGVWRSLHGDEQGNGPNAVSYLVANLKRYAERDYFSKGDPYHLHHIGFFIGMYHGGILSPQTGLLHPNVTALAVFDHKDAQRGYRVGREWYFHEAEPQERRLDEQTVITRLRELVLDNPYQQGGSAATWYYCIGCLLGELSGQVFPETAQERQVWQEECRKWEARKVQEARGVQRSAILQEA